MPERAKEPNRGPTTGPPHKKPTGENQPPTTAFARLDSERKRVYSLVLSSAGIPHTLARRTGTWSIQVAGRHRKATHRAIALYLAENPVAPLAAPAAAPLAWRPTSAVFAALLLTAVHMAVTTSGQETLFVTAFGADARRILEGDLYRCITALLLHSDGAHLLANLAGTLLFGTLVSGYLGWGVGWLLIVIAGGSGNALTALWYGDAHLSIGASTGIFAALGICAVAAFWRRYRYGGRQRSWLSLAGALALMGWMGGSPRSDLAAHLFGLLAGCALGALYPLGLDRQLPWPWQAAAVFVAALLVAGSCGWGFFRGAI